MRITSMVVVGAALAACASDRRPHEGWTRASGASRYEATDAASVRVLHKRPAGAEVLGQVHGVHRERTAMEDAKHRASELGADAIVVLAVGDEESFWPMPPFSVGYVEAEAVRTER